MRPDAEATSSAPLTACVITYQEEECIGDCLRSLSFCSEILVVDSGSTDRTCEIAEQLGARVIVNKPFPGHSEQKQFAVEHAQHDWVLSMDADERVTPELKDRLLQLAAEGLQGAAFWITRRNYYLGRRMRFGLFAPEPKIRLFDRRQARWGGVNPHDRVEVLQGASVQSLSEPFDHYSYRTVKEHLRQIESFTRLDAEAKHREGRSCSLPGLLIRPVSSVMKGLFLKLGFLDGWRGLVICGLAGYYNWLKCLRLRQLCRAHPPPVQESR